jgi:hypothetical protein
MSCQEEGRKEKERKKKVHPNDLIFIALCPVYWMEFLETPLLDNDEMDDFGSSFRFKCNSFMKERKKERKREREKVCVCVIQAR